MVFLSFFPLAVAAKAFHSLGGSVSDLEFAILGNVDMKGQGRWSFLKGGSCGILEINARY